MAEGFAIMLAGILGAGPPGKIGKLTKGGLRVIEGGGKKTQGKFPDITVIKGGKDPLLTKPRPWQIIPGVETTFPPSAADIVKTNKEIASKLGIKTGKQKFTASSFAQRERLGPSHNIPGDDYQRLFQEFDDLIDQEYAAGLELIVRPTGYRLILSEGRGKGSLGHLTGNMAHNNRLSLVVVKREDGRDFIKARIEKIYPGDMPAGYKTDTFVITTGQDKKVGTFDISKNNLQDTIYSVLDKLGALEGAPF